MQSINTFNFLLSMILLFPFFSFLVCIALGRFFSKKGIVFVSLASLCSCLCVSVYCCCVVLSYSDSFIHFSTITFFEWATVSNFTVYFGFLVDPLSLLMILLVVFVSTLVHCYSVEYMSEDPHLTRFLSYLSLFTFFMLLFIIAPNYLQTFLGWEGVGLSSYLLINFWYTRLNANKSAMKAIIVNRISDSFLYFGILYLFVLFQTLDIRLLFLLVPQSNILSSSSFPISDLSVVGLCFFIGAMGKSAQIGLHTWLPDAMEGPTPVSALIHAATMVTAGVYLIIRSSFLFAQCPDLLVFVLFIGSLTAVFAGSIGCFQHDIKKIIAYSTCSQLGYMVLICGLANFSLSFFHLFNHGFFKALLFLGAGSVIHSVSDEQDIRKMGSLHELLPVSYASFFIGSVALMGFPFLTGFYSKDSILELAFCTLHIPGVFAYWLGILAAFFTAFYSLRLIYYVFFSSVNAVSPRSYLHETESYMFISLVILCFLSIVAGFFFKDIFIGTGSDIFDTSIYKIHSVGQWNNEDSVLFSEFWMFHFYKHIPLFCSLIGCTAGFFSVKFASYLFQYYYWRFGAWFLSYKWFFDPIYNLLFVRFFMAFCYQITYKLIDKGFIEFFGSFNLVSFFATLSRAVSLIQTGFIHHYIFLMFISLILYLLLVFFGSVLFFNLMFLFFTIYLYKQILGKIS